MADPRSPGMEHRRASLLRRPPTDPHDESDEGNAFDLSFEETPSPVTSVIRHRLYVSHILSTWNSHLFEFGAVLYLASIFPGTLLPVSVYTVARGAAAIILSPAVGQYVDIGNLLHVVRLSIIVQRLVVAASCLLFYFLSFQALAPAGSITYILLGLLIVLACLGKLCAIMNLVAVERDWVVVIVKGNEASLREINSQMRRIDLFCKLGGPFAISMLDGFSTRVAILVNLGMNLVSVIAEYYANARVYHEVEALQLPKTAASSTTPKTGSTFVQIVKIAARKQGGDLLWYFRHRACRASVAGALLSFTVLSFAGQMTTYLLSEGFNSIHVAIMRTGSVAFEISATWLAPWLMTRIGPVRSGIWFINWQMLCLTGAVSSFWFTKTPVFADTALVIGTIFSRIGLWGFDLTTQLIVQEEVDDDRRGSFSSIEASFQNLFEICSFATTIVASRPSQFRWPVLMSCGTVYTAAIIYASFVRSRRGHLLHLSSCIEGDDKSERGQQCEYHRLSVVRE